MTYFFLEMARENTLASETDGGLTSSQETFANDQNLSFDSNFIEEKVNNGDLDGNIGQISTTSTISPGNFPVFSDGFSGTTTTWDLNRPLGNSESNSWGNEDASSRFQDTNIGTWSQNNVGRQGGSFLPENPSPGFNIDGTTNKSQSSDNSWDKPGNQWNSEASDGANSDNSQRGNLRFPDSYEEPLP